MQTLNLLCCFWHLPCETKKCSHFSQTVLNSCSRVSVNTVPTVPVWCDDARGNGSAAAHVTEKPPPTPLPEGGRASLGQEVGSRVYDAGYRLLNFPSSAYSSANAVRERTVFIFLEGRTEADGCHASSYRGGGGGWICYFWNSNWTGAWSNMSFVKQCCCQMLERRNCGPTTVTKIPNAGVNIDKRNLNTHSPDERYTREHEDSRFAECRRLQRNTLLWSPPPHTPTKPPTHAGMHQSTEFYFPLEACYVSLLSLELNSTIRQATNTPPPPPHPNNWQDMVHST